MATVSAECRILKSLSLVCVDNNLFYRGKEFEKRQKEHRVILKGLCITSHLKIKSQVDDIFSQLSDIHFKELQIEWKSYIEQVDNLVLQALLHSVKESLQDLSKAINGYSDRSDTHPLFSTFVLLQNDNVECFPSMIEITHSMNEYNEMKNSYRKLESTFKILENLCN